MEITSKGGGNVFLFLEKLQILHLMNKAKNFFTRFSIGMMKISPEISTYVRELPNAVKLSKYPLTKMDSAKLEGIQYGIPLFEGVKFDDIAFITKQLETLNLFRGCKWGCKHCLKNAMAPKPGRESILFEDLKRFVYGFKQLSERLGFDVLNGNKYLNIIDDSNPIDVPIKGLSREHSVAEGMKLIYEKLGIPTLFVTSGWTDMRNGRYKYSIDAAKRIVNMVRKNPDSVKEVEISINPFLETRNYASRMARTLLTFLDLFKIDKASIIFRHADEEYPAYNKNAASNLYQDIYKELKRHCDFNLESIPQLKPEVVTKFDKSHLIEPSGRGRKFFPIGKNMKLQKELIQDSLEWELMSKEEQREALLNRALKCVDIDGGIYTTKPSNANFVNTPIELTIPTDIKLNYINKDKPNPIFSDIEV